MTDGARPDCFARPTGRLIQTIYHGLRRIRYQWALVMVCLSYGIWQSWWLAALWMTAAFMAVLMPKRPGDAIPQRDGAAAAP